MKKLFTTAMMASALALSAAAAQAGEIAVIVKTTNSNFWQNVNKGASAAIEGQQDHTMTFNGPASGSAIAGSGQPCRKRDQPRCIGNRTGALRSGSADPGGQESIQNPKFPSSSSTPVWPTAARSITRHSCRRITARPVSLWPTR
ncbi:hypothetical protein OKA06_19905 [Novosphingobium sp. MW5]|nr:hypothetical protein [Novosphingobium sp. MW5]